MSGYRPNGGTATAFASSVSTFASGFPGDRSPGKPGLRDDSGHLGLCSSLFFPDLPPLPEQEFMPYGIATVRLYVGPVKRVALPIVSQAINLLDA